MTPRQLADREIAEIEWRHGLAPCPEHLIEQGTVRQEFWCGVRLKPGLELPVGYFDDADAVPLSICNWEQYELDEPYYEVRVWGELVERGRLQWPRWRRRG